MLCQIVVLRVHSKQSYGKAGLQPVHVSGPNFVMFFSAFFVVASFASFPGASASVSAGAKGFAGALAASRKALADVPFSC